ncbi:MAG: T9SS type A sorting domain-containing protein [Flavobacteriales bacterium]|nr:T9SS type A sorting domain-containing protein [Flavobacteriales bacterium]
MKNNLILLLLLCPILAFSQTWETVSTYNGAGRHHPITFSIDGFGYVLSGSTYQPDFYKYDPVADSWTQLDDFPGGGRGFSYGVVWDGKAYVGFGFDGQAYLNDLWEYDPETETWTELASCPCDVRIHPAMVAVNGAVYMGVGGGNFSNLGDFWEYDIANDTWTEKATFPSWDRHHPYYFGIGDYVYVGFGHGTQIQNGTDVYNDFYRYDPANDQWMEIDSFEGEARVAGTQFSYGGKGYVLSGQGEDHLHFDDGEFHEYDPETDTWTQLNSHPGGGRWAPGSFVIGNRIYLTSGEIVTNTPPFVQNVNTTISAVLPENTVSVWDLEDPSTGISYFPNPASSILNVQVNGGETLVNAKISVQNLSGQLVVEQIVEANNTVVDVESLPQGIYFVQVWADGVLLDTQKFAKK